MYRKILIISIIAIFAFGQLQAQEFAPVGTAVAQFLEIGIGARGTGMGEAYTAMTNDAGSAFWNPAGVADVQERNFYTAYNSWPAEIAIGGFSMAMNMGNVGTFAVSGIYLLTDDMEVTTIYQPEGTGEMFSLTNFAIGLTYARYLTDRLSVGITNKIVREDYYGHGYTTWAMDLGTIYHTGFRGLKLGMSILHFSPEISYSGEYIDFSDDRSYSVDKPKSFEEWSLPINFRFGVAFDVMNTEQHKITGAADMIHPNNNLEQYNFGFEYGFNNLLFLRSGYRFNLDEGGMNFGAGFRYNLIGDQPFAIDYSFSDLGVLENIHRVSLAVSF
jgi:hypothetical protein